MSSARRSARALVVAGLMAAVAPCVAHAQDGVRLSADAQADIGYSNNPFTQSRGTTSSGVVDVQVTPRAVLNTERSEFVLSGYAQYQRYFRIYDDSQNYAATLSYRGKPSEHINTHLGLSYENSIVGNRNPITGAFDPSQPDLLPITGSDLSLFGTRDRRQSFRVDGDAGWTLSDRDTLTPSAYFVRSRYSRFGEFGDYDGYGGTLAYSRRISDHLQLGGQGSVAKYDYRGVQNDSTIYSVRGSFSADFGPRWKIDGALGVSFVGQGGRSSRKTFSGNVNLCRIAERANLCVTGSRSVVPSGLAGTQTETSLGANYSYKLSERNSVFASADYVRNGANSLAIFNQRVEYLRGSIGFDHQLKQRIRIITSGQYRDVHGLNGNVAADYGGQIGVAVKLGDIK